MSTYVRTVKTFHKRDCPVLKRAKAVHDWTWMDTNSHLTPEGYGRAVAGAPQYVQACRRCFPSVRLVTRRSPVALAAINARKTHCPQGHPYDEANTYVWKTRTGLKRHCRICNRASVAAYLAKKKVAS